MKRFLASSFFLVFLYVFAIGQTQTITARLVKKLVGQEVIVRGKLCTFANSSYAQTAWYYLGKDTAHRESSVVLHAIVLCRSEYSLPVYELTGTQTIGLFTHIHAPVCGQPGFGKPAEDYRRRPIFIYGNCNTARAFNWYDLPMGIFRPLTRTWVLSKESIFSEAIINERCTLVK
jgi:hypothetical protein